MRYQENYKTVLADIEANPVWYRGVNTRLCDKKALFEDFNYKDQYGKPWPYKPSPAVTKGLKSLVPAKLKVSHGSGQTITTLIWKRQKLDYRDSHKSWEIMFSASRAPKLFLFCFMNGANFYQFEASTLEAQIDNFHKMFKTMPKLKTVILDEDISPDKNALCQVARQYGAKSTVICHGQLGIISGFLPLTADFIQVKYPEQKSKLIKWGLEPFRIIVKRGV